MCNIYLSICMVFLFNVVVGQSEFSCSSLRSEGSIVTKQDTALKGHVRQSLAKVSFIQCGLRCQRHQWCISINFQIATGQCELNDYGVKDETSAEGEEFEKRQGFVYSQLRPEKFGCQDNTCLNGGTCRTNCTNWQTVCICKMGFVGNKCEVDLNECSSNPCQNGGSCSDRVNGYNCTCVAGYNGTNCEHDIDECSISPCKNGGSCSDQVNGYKCTCVAGFIGKNCETNINECSSSPCKNGGTCKDQINGYNCTCLVGFAGKNCELNINECSSSPCQNGGSCLDKVNSYKCTCLEGYNGTNCEIKQNACELYWKDKSTRNYVSGAAWLASQDLSSFTVSVWLKVPSSFNKELVPFSYLTSSEKDALWIKIKKDKKAEIKVMGDAKSKMIAFDRDDSWQHIAITWERNNVQDKGTVIFYHNGKDVSNDKDLSKDDNLKKGGILIIGQKQGSHGGEFDKDKLMVGHMTLLNIWSRVFTINEVQALSKNCTSPDGDVVAWSDVLTKTLKGSVKKICPSNCT